MNPTLWFMTSYSDKLVTCPTASAELRAFFLCCVWPWPVKLSRADLCCHYRFKCTELRRAAALEMDHLWSAARALESLHGRCGYVWAAESQLTDPPSLLPPLPPPPTPTSELTWSVTGGNCSSLLYFCFFNFNVNVFSLLSSTRATRFVL